MFCKNVTQAGPTRCVHINFSFQWFWGPQCTFWLKSFWFKLHFRPVVVSRVLWRCPAQRLTDRKRNSLRLSGCHKQVGLSGPRSLFSLFQTTDTADDGQFSNNRQSFSAKCFRFLWHRAKWTLATKLFPSTHWQPGNVNATMCQYQLLNQLLNLIPFVPYCSKPMSWGCNLFRMHQSYDKAFLQIFKNFWSTFNI